MTTHDVIDLMLSNGAMEKGLATVYNEMIEETVWGCIEWDKMRMYWAMQPASAEKTWRLNYYGESPEMGLMDYSLEQVSALVIDYLTNCDEE